MTDKPTTCSCGHYARYSGEKTGNPRCSKCYLREYWEINKEKLRKVQKAWVNNNKEKVKLSWKRYVDSGKEEVTRKLRSKTPEFKKRALERANKCKEKDPNRYRLNQRNYHASRRCLGGRIVNQKELVKIYKSCPVDKEVDHIVPIKHKDVCGLHVPWNMQYLTRSENATKSNSFDGTYDNKGWRNA